ncbi:MULTISPECIES: GntR family transcriptional regulator [Streptomyces]|uniref:GntR family transcriptional regulator n=1 Tax=Streptomyces TaxID=1883 RepID=UPI0037939230
MPREAPYLALADALRRRIRAGEWEIGARLPSPARLAEEYGADATSYSGPWTS